MFNLLPRLEVEFPWLHTRSGTEKDAMEFCERQGVPVLFRPDFPMGVWVMADGHHFICINSELRGWLLVYVLFHEISHYLFHVPTQSNFEIEFCHPHVTRKQHVEAEQSTALILLPPSELANVFEIGADTEYAELESLVEVRRELFKTLGK